MGIEWATGLLLVLGVTNLALIGCLLLRSG